MGNQLLIKTPASCTPNKKREKTWRDLRIEAIYIHLVQQRQLDAPDGVGFVILEREFKLIQVVVQPMLLVKLLNIFRRFWVKKYIYRNMSKKPYGVSTHACVASSRWCVDTAMVCRHTHVQPFFTLFVPIHVNQGKEKR